ncbi:MAG: hypothetical protein ACRECL_12245 [Bradyrhizobium sp.]
MAHQQAYPVAGDGEPRGNKILEDASTTARRLLMAVAVLFAVGLFGAPALASSGPFAGMAGRWAGGGTVSLQDGSVERIRCRAAYDVDGPRMGLRLTCASDSYKFSFLGNVTAERGGVITGNWSESTHNINGTLRGRGANGVFRVLASGSGFNANISLTTRGNHQSVVIKAASQFRGASINLSRR